MAIKILNLIWAADPSVVPYKVKLVAARLADHAHSDGSYAYPSVGRLAYELGCSRRTIQSALKALKKAGVIRIQIPFDRQRSKPNTYMFDLGFLLTLQRPFSQQHWKGPYTKKPPTMSAPRAKFALGVGQNLPPASAESAPELSTNLQLTVRDVAGKNRSDQERIAMLRELQAISNDLKSPTPKWIALERRATRIWYAASEDPQIKAFATQLLSEIGGRKRDVTLRPHVNSTC